MDDSSWEDLDVDDSDLPSLIHPSKTLLPCKRPQHQINNKSSSSSHQTIPSFSLEPCSQNPRFRPSSPSQPEYINPETLVSQSQQTHHHHYHTHFEKEEEGPSTSGQQHLIPGPAGKIQAAMNRKVLYNRNNEEKITTLECLRRIHEDEDEDQDFKSNPWLCALEFHGNEGGSKVLDGNGVPRSPLKTIKTLRNDRVPRVVAVIDSCTPNGFGDLSVTLKDPTGTIGANIHRKVITESEFGKDISVGCVLILQQVVVFSPSLSTHYLNITLRNIVKVISKNSGPPTKTYHASTDRLAPYGTEERREIRPQPPMIEKSSFLRSREAELVNAVREKGKKAVDNDIQMEESRPARESFHFTSSGRYRNASEVESLLMRNKKTDGTRMEAVRRDSCNADLTIIDDNDDHSKEASQSKTINRSSNSAAIEVEEDHRHETGRAKSEVEKPEKQQLVSTTSLPEWTNEQLEELFADGW